MHYEARPISLRREARSLSGQEELPTRADSACNLMACFAADFLDGPVQASHLAPSFCFPTVLPPL